ncbi:MAG: homoserine kinase, partial [Actinomycetota bacterium]|nr:homoserine kinase [Actinomycetota bacterium]
IHGGFVLCSPSDGDAGLTATRLEVPQGVEAVIVIPEGERLPTSEAREVVPGQIAHADAVANVAAASQLVLGIERSDLALISRGLADRLHQPYRAHLYPRSMQVVDAAGELGALGATISGAGPAVLVWCFWQDTGKVIDALSERFGEAAEISRVPFSALGADVPEL